ncbi:MAG: UDP-N-acetylmuramoyl-L-alanine--D-glutamate ligase [Planctomycetota bacterium]|jgi:UDP-N-acetylmuramoylalanine--D-glutamate ligase
MQDDRYNFAGKKVLVMGLGRFGGGVDCAEFAARAGTKVLVTDSSPAEKLKDSIDKLKEFPDIEFHLGSHDEADFRWADIIIVNPAVPDDNEFLEIASRNNKFITYQINIFFELCPAQIVGITGANGKSTTTALTAHLLRNTSIENVWLSGNIGNQPLLTILDKIEADDLVVLELSSFQLESLAQIAKAPKVALLTNLTPNHLDRHGTFENYCAAKENIFKYQQLNDNRPAISIFNAEDKIAAEWFEKYKKDTGRICIRFSTDDVSKEIRDSFKLSGLANLSNLAAAIAIARRFGIDDEQIKKSLPEFRSLPHRLEFVSEINGVSWYNDSIATTPQSAIAALEAFDGARIIIAGGYDKDLPFEELGEKIAANTKAAILLGQTAPKIASAIKLSPQAGIKIQIVNSLAKAVETAARIADPGDIVLLSPACASYDMFENFQHRGQEFTKLVRALNS